MSDEVVDTGGDVDASLEGGNYEVIKQRLAQSGAALLAKVEALNAKRKEVFGGTELSVVANERVRTENNCVPRDIVAIGDLLLFGYNVFIGLKSETSPKDVFALHRFQPASDSGQGYDCSAVPLDSAGGFLVEEQFLREFDNLYRYYKDARLLRLVKTDTALLAVFQSGQKHTDVKVFRWRIEADGGVRYVDDRGDGDYKFPPAYDFEWTEVVREDQSSGRFPHYGILDEIFVDTHGGTLTIKVEDNTETGHGIYDEPVEDKNQVLDDGKFFYVRLGELILLKVLPFREQRWRYLVYNRRTQSVVRIDAIGQACRQLPEDQGILFPGGFYLQTGDYKVFDGDNAGLEFERAIRSPNGEDVLYVFHRKEDGHYALLSYNMIRKEVTSPIHCHGYSAFEDGRVVVFRAVSDEPTRVHPMQVWQTPFTSAAFAAAAPTDGSFLAKVGNAELVRGISDAFSIARLTRTETPNRFTFEDIIATSAKALDSYYWLGHADVGDLKSAVAQVRTNAELIVDEFEKVIAFRAEAKQVLAEAEEQFAAAVRDLHPERWHAIEPFLDALTSLRKQRGHLISLKEVRYIDLPRVEQLEAQTVEHFDRVSRDCVQFLLRDEAFAPLSESLEQTLANLADVKKVADAAPLREQVEKTAEGLDLLSDVVGNLKIEDATQRTAILEDITEVFAQVNRTRAQIENRYRDLMSHEGRAEFGAQFKLLGQSVASALSLCDTPERCDEEMSRIMVQLEELESRFSEFDEFLADLAGKREEIYEAFGARKQTLLDERQRRVQNIVKAAERILEGVKRRASTLGAADELNAYFASDAMVMKLRELADQLVELGDSVKADEIHARIKAARQDALRAMRDKLDLYEDGAAIIKLGQHRFSVNTQPLELSMVPREGDMWLHLGGTDFYEPIADEAFAATREFWSQDLISETPEVYRGEYLAACLLADAEQGAGGLSIDRLRDAAATGGLADVVKEYAQDRYDEGYDRGLHDADAALILDKLLVMRDTVGLLRFPANQRAAALLFWAWHDDADARTRWHRQAVNLGRLRAAFGDGGAVAELAAELGEAIAAFAADDDLSVLGAIEPELAGRYLVEELMAEAPRFATSAAAVRLGESLQHEMELQGVRAAFEDDLRALDGRLGEQLLLAKAWVDASVARNPDSAHAALEATVSLIDRGLDREPSSALTELQVEGLLGRHPRIKERQMSLRIDEFTARLTAFRTVRAPAYRAYRALRAETVARERDRLRIDELKPKVMTAFVRNKLINDVYLHIVGDNLAKQIGAAGAAKRTDLMGMLLLISPPGYGKTTLMEYIASRLGLVFVKVNGPSLGHAVHSLDPTEAPNATARQEVEKINLALEMGNNVMLYLDDIQHTHPELLQKFISLCDAQRRIEGVWKGRTRTYDMRGKKFCVVMAGNPYTESGDKFQIPDMLSNRADVYNLGDILHGKDELFALSYIENALTSNQVLAPLATREQADVYKLIRMAQGEQIPTTELAHGYSAVELQEVLAVLRHMFRCQQVLLSVNQQYIISAAQDDAFRTEPPFKLQGSYRNMNKLAEKVVSAMTEDEVASLIDDHYLGEAQTLTTEAEQNLLKLAELRGRMTDEQRARWDEIKGEFRRQKRMGGAEDDPVVRVTGTLSGLGEQLEGIRAVLSSGPKLGGEVDKLGAQLEGIRAALANGSSMAAQVDRLAEALAKLAPGNMKVEVTTEPPAGVQELLAQQVSIVERTLVPMVRAATQDLHDSQGLARQLAQVIELLEEVDLRLRETNPLLPRKG